MRRFLRDNGLSLVLFGLFFSSFLVGQSIAGHREYNDDQSEHGRPTITYAEYLGSSHFLEATMENWESEFLQMFFYIILTVFLFQKGSSESKDPDGPNEVDREPRPDRKDAPGPVRRGGLALRLYENSLSIVFLLLFLGSFYLHAVGGAREYSEEQREHGRGGQEISAVEYMGTSRFWFESFQNWQSEFLAIGAMVLLSVWLRQKGSPESKPVDAPHGETGSG